MSSGFGLPAYIRDEQPLAAAKAQGVFDPDRAVAQRSAQGKQGGHFQCPERPLTVDVSDGLTPCRAQARCRDLARQTPGACSVQSAQPVQRVDGRMLARGLPGQAAHRNQQGTHRRNGVDEVLADDRRSAGRAPGTLGCDQTDQARTQFGIWHLLLGRKIGQFLEQLLVLLRPVNRCRHTVGALPPEVGHTTLEHEDELICGRQQAIAQEAGHLDSACRLLDPGADRGRTGGHAPRIPAHQYVVEMAQVLIDPQIRQEGNTFEHLGDLARRVLGRCAPQPALAVLAIQARTVQRRRPAFEKAGWHCGSDRLGSGGLEFGQCNRHQAADDTVVHDEEPVFVQPMPGMQQQPLTIGAVGHFIAQNSHQRSTLVLGHPGKAQRLAGLLLVIEQGSATGVQRTQRRQVGGGDAQHLAQVTQQDGRDRTHTV